MTLENNFIAHKSELDAIDDEIIECKQYLERQKNEGESGDQ